MINKEAQRQVCKVKVGISYKLRYVSPNIFSISQIFSALATSRVCNWSRATCLLSGQSSRSQLRPMLACVMAAADNHNHHAFTNIFEFAETRNKRTIQCICMTFEDILGFQHREKSTTSHHFLNVKVRALLTVDHENTCSLMTLRHAGAGHRIQSWSVTALHPTSYIPDTCYQWFVFTCGHA